VAAAGVPAKVAVPLPLSVKAMPLGSAPLSLNEGDGDPAAVTVNVPGELTVKVVPAALVMDGP